MWIRNVELANKLDRIADILELTGANVFKVRAYRKAALAIENLSDDIEAIHDRGDLDGVSGVGRGIASKTREFLDTGNIGYYEELCGAVPPGLLEMVDLPGLSPRTVRKLRMQTGATSVRDLERLARAHRLREVKGLGRKTEERILRAIELADSTRERWHLGIAWALAREIRVVWESLGSLRRLYIVGSTRRYKETVANLNVLVTSEHPTEVIETFAEFPLSESLKTEASTHARIVMRPGLCVDLRVVPESLLGFALHFYTGSKSYNTKFHEVALQRGLRYTEKGLFKAATGGRIAAQLEQDVFQAIGLPFIPPEMREDRGEIEAALNDALPTLLEQEDVKGDLHIHSQWSDGADSIEEIARAAQALGYEYIAITDHSKTLKIAGGLAESDLLRQVEEIRQLNKRLGNLRILAGVEAEIRADGSLDLSDDVLSKLDVVIASVHTALGQDAKSMTRRLITAMHNPYVHIIGHPTGRLLGRPGKMKDQRPPYPLDFTAVLKAAAETSTCLEMNAFPERLDLNDQHARLARQYEVPIAIGTDAHNGTHLQMMEFGVGTARRAWLERGDVLNTLSYEELIRRLNKKRKSKVFKQSSFEW